MITAMSNALSSFVSRYLPDPLIFAVLLNFIVFVCAVMYTPHQPMELIGMWGDGFWNLLAFSMQMAMIVVTGNVLASSKPVKRLLSTIAEWAKTPAEGVALVTFAGTIACYINWGFGLIVGAMLAKEVARKHPTSNYGLLIASAYIAFMIWGSGLSGSMPLQAATPGNPMAHLMVTPDNPLGIVPVSETLFAPFNLFVCAALLISLPLITRAMAKSEVTVHVNPELLAPEPDFHRELPPNASWAERMEESKVLNYLLVLMGVIYLAQYFYTKGFALTINTVNLVFLIVGLALHGSLMAYARAAAHAVKSTIGILIQFPFYAGIQILMEDSGLGGYLTEAFVSIATPETFPVLTFISSGLINFAVPSGGGHWVVQGPFIIPASQEIGADMAKSVMAIAYGDQWMNMAQPFWALPALGIAGLGVRDIMGYCLTALILTGPIFVIGLYLF